MVIPIKRIEILERSIRFKQPRIITIVAEAEPEDQCAADAKYQEIIDQVQPQPDDLVVRVNRFSPSEGLPRLHSISS
jgi:hypothetical protein